MHRFALLSLVAMCALRALASAADSRPNILFAIGDNWAYPHASILGEPVVQTPVFDRMAREGILFTHAFCPVPSCSPTRSSLLTGRAAHQLEDAASLWSKWPAKFRTFTDALRDSGYRIGFTGKGWSPGNHKDFGREENPAGPQLASFEEFLGDPKDGQPFFFWLGNVSTSLHQWHAGAGEAAGLRPADIRVPGCLPDTPEVRGNMADYFEAVGRMDAAIGAAIQLIESKGLMDNTLIVYTSDNGWQMPRGLANCYDTGARVPLAVRWTGKITPGRKADEFVNLNDFAPTFMELAGLDPLPEMTARSFADILLGRPSATPRDAVFLERERHANVRQGDLSYPIRAIRTADFLYLRNLRPDRWPAGDPELYFAVGPYGDVDPTRSKDVIIAGKDRPEMKRFYDLSFAKRPAEELYDLRKDPEQLHNVAGSSAYADAKARLSGRVDQWMKDTADPRVDENCDAWDAYPYFGKKITEQRPPK